MKPPVILTGGFFICSKEFHFQLENSLELLRILLNDRDICLKNKAMHADWQVFLIANKVFFKKFLIYTACN